MRLFISINVPEELSKYCRQLQKNFPEIKNTNEFHLTIQFLGDEIKSEKEILEELNKIKFKPFEIEMGDVVTFGNPKNPKGVWIECRENTELQKLASDIRKLMENLRYKPDYPFRAHITLGRYKNTPKELPKKIRGEANKFKVEHFYLMESVLSPAGPKYNKIAKF